jgi:hypothetical protein
MNIKLQTDRRAAMLLMECIVYLAVFAVLLGGGTAVFYFCWNHTQATVQTANDVQTALLEGEQWRLDVRTATGTIYMETTATGEIVHIPIEFEEVVYRLKEGELRREIPAQKISRLLPVKVKSSEMKPEVRDGATAWRWELEIAPRRNEDHLPLLFTFEAAPRQL